MAPKKPKNPTLAEALEADLLRLYRAPMIGGRRLREALGYETAITFRVAVSRGTLGVRVFKVPGRRGYWALVKEISRWAASASEGTHKQEREVIPKPLGSK